MLTPLKEFCQTSCCSGVELDELEELDSVDYMDIEAIVGSESCHKQKCKKMKEK